MEDPERAREDGRVRRILLVAAALLGYVALTALLTYPLVARFWTAVPGAPGDASIFLWNSWWVKHALLDLKVNPFRTDYIFYPGGTSLVFHALTFLNGLASIPLQELFGLVAAHNTVIFASFVLSAFGAYLLVRHVTGNELASFIGGAVFAFCPYKFAHLLGHVHLVSTQWIPFYVLFVLRMTTEAPRRVRHAVCAGLFLILIGYTDYSYLLHSLLFTGILFGWTILADRTARRDPSFWKAYLVLAGVFLLGFSPVLLLAAQEAAHGDYPTVHGGGGSAAFVADLLGFVTPPVFHPVLKTWGQAVSRHFKGNVVEWTVFLGFTVIFLSLVAVRRRWRDCRSVRFWAVVGLVFLVLSMGPYLRVLGHKVVPLPGYFLTKTPVLNHLRAPSRFNLMTMLCCAVLSAYGLTYLLGATGGRRRRGLLASGVLALILFEYLAVPYPMWDAAHHPIYDLIRADREDCTVLEIPLGYCDGTHTLGLNSEHLMYFQTIHEKKMFGGLVARFPEHRLAHYRSLPLIGRVLSLEEGEHPEMNPSEETALAHEAVRRFKVKYVIVHRPYIGSPSHRYLTEILPLAEVWRDDELVAYRVE